MRRGFTFIRTDEDCPGCVADVHHFHGEVKFEHALSDSLLELLYRARLLDAPIYFRYPPRYEEALAARLVTLGFLPICNGKSLNREEIENWKGAKEPVAGSLFKRKPAPPPARAARRVRHETRMAQGLNRVAEIPAVRAASRAERIDWLHPTGLYMRGYDGNGNRRIMPKPRCP